MPPRGRRWRQTVQGCQARLREYLGGKPAIRWERLAWEEIIKLAQAAEPREVIETTAAMVVMPAAKSLQAPRESRPKR